GELVPLLALLDARPIDPQAHRAEPEREGVRALLFEAAGLPPDADHHPALGEEQLAALTTALLNTSQLASTYAESCFDGDLLYFRATRADHVSDGDDWRSRITGAVISHDLECTHNTITQTDQLAVIGGLLTRHLQREPAAATTGG
ncbi:non-ribosomal peptide synthetase, partial [Saccharopolyspora kobensis]